MVSDLYLLAVIPVGITGNTYVCEVLILPLKHLNNIIYLSVIQDLNNFEILILYREPEEPEYFSDGSAANWYRTCA